MAVFESEWGAQGEAHGDDMHLIAVADMTTQPVYVAQYTTTRSFAVVLMSKCCL